MIFAQISLTAGRAKAVQATSQRRHGIRSPFLAALAALLFSFPCVCLLVELSYVAHPSYAHEFGSVVRNLLATSFDRRQAMTLIAFLACFTFFQEVCLRRWPLRRERSPAAWAAVLALTAAVVGFSIPWMDVGVGGSLSKAASLFLGRFFFVAPWIVYAYVVRSAMAYADHLQMRLCLYVGSVFVIIAATMACARVFGVNDGEVQSAFAFVGTIPMVSILSGGILAVTSQTGARSEGGRGKAHTPGGEIGTPSR